jgi:hypothetical protein
VSCTSPPTSIHTISTTCGRLERALTEAGFRVEKLFDFHRFSVPEWWWISKVLRRKTFSRVQLKVVNTLLPLLRRVDRFLPWGGLSLIGIGVKDRA